MMRCTRICRCVMGCARCTGRFLRCGFRLKNLFTPRTALRPNRFCIFTPLFSVFTKSTVVAKANGATAAGVSAVPLAAALTTGAASPARFLASETKPVPRRVRRRRRRGRPRPRLLFLILVSLRRWRGIFSLWGEN